uniref:Alpha/beta hydrolase fold-3 domain-containing protein n=1 Tax=Coccidioides posadasii RMSCC 3488 TaxID=454284 RepID=A0A0J6FCI3_COCPO|nr:hypothetical protein CPAG_03341 [Coccidioides posadasii RMSCC 3488]
MVFESDVSLNVSKFQPSAIPPASHAVNQHIMSMADGKPRWWEVGAQTFREMRARGETAMPPSALLDCAQSFSIPSREPGRNIPCRIIKPEGSSAPSGVFLHIHGGGWVLMDEESQDALLKHYTDAANLVSISVGYRLAPEHPYPAGPEDCYDVAEWLVENAEKEFGAPLKFMGGESAGGHLSALTALHLLSHENPKYSDFKFKGLLLHFGVFDLSFTPTTYTFKRSPALVIDRESMTHSTNAFLQSPASDPKDPKISPLYFDFLSLTASGKSLPPAVFTCGTEDVLLDDTIFMSAKWQMAGGEAIVKIVPGAPHGYIMCPPGLVPGTEEILELLEKFLKEKV